MEIKTDPKGVLKLYSPVVNKTSENRILQLLAVRGTWAGTDRQGRELLRLLTDLTGDPDTRPESCPADLAPAWVAHLMPWWDAAGTVERWSGLMRQIGELAPRFGELQGEIGRRALAGCQLVSRRVALRHAGDAAPAVERVGALWERVLRGDEPTDDDWQAAAWVAETAKGEAGAVAAVWAALAAVLAAEARVAAEAATWATEAAESATQAAAQLVASRAAAVRAAEAAARAAADEIIQGHIDAIRAALATELINNRDDLKRGGDE